MVLTNHLTQSLLHRFSRLTVDHQKSPPPNAYYRTPHGVPTSILVSDFPLASTPSQNPQVPSPAVFTFPSSSSSADALPIPAQCATHLCLLSSFYHLRARILACTTLDAALGIAPEPRTVYSRSRRAGRMGWVREEKKLRDEGFRARQEEKWAMYLGWAAGRFLSWAEAVDNAREEKVLLPPIDVLMVWHALLLNPSWMRAFEVRDLKRLLKTPFPWEEIHKALDASQADWPYRLPSESAAWFLSQTGLEPDLFAVLTNATKSPRLHALLKPRPLLTTDTTTTYLRIPLPDIDSALLDDLHDAEVPLLSCYRASLAHAPTVTALVDAVQRQCAFIDKMERHLWIRSPALDGTLARAIDRYANFLRLFGLNPKTTLVPTLDIDLVWHTHQCSPAQYDAGTLARAGRLIDHNDKLGKGTLDDGFGRTKELYRVRFGTDYLACNCWDCEALASAVTAGSREDAGDERAVAERVLQEVAHHRALEIARRRGDSLFPLPRRKA